MQSSEDTFNEWQDDFKRVIFFFLCNKKFSVNKIYKDNNGRVPIIEA